MLWGLGTDRRTSPFYRLHVVHSFVGAKTAMRVVETVDEVSLIAESDLQTGMLIA